MALYIPEHPKSDGSTEVRLPGFRNESPTTLRRGNQPSTPEMAHYDIAHKLAFAPLMFQAARVARDNGLLAALEQAEGEGLPADEAAKRAGCSRYAARVLLEACLSMNLVVLKSGHYQLAPAGQLVLRDKMTRVNMDFTNDVCFAGSLKLDASLKESKPRGLDVFGDWSTIYAGLSALPEKARKSWDAFDHYYSDGVFPKVQPLVLSRPGLKLLDVGGNTGKWAVLCTQRDPQMTVTILDHPAQLAQAKENARAAGVDARVSGIGLDLLDHSRPFPTGFDVVWMSQFLDCFGEDDIVSLLSRGKEALASDGKLYILETYWDRQPNATAQYCIHATSLYFACMANGQSRMYHSDDLRACVEQAGLRIVRDHQLGYHTLWETVPTTRL